MASSSSCKYDVFLSFRGEDTRDNFTSHLFAAFHRKKIRTFIDNEELRRGDDISPALLNAIECSMMSVIIFSKNYASSKWCLNELVKIIQCHQMNGQMVLPVFYRVDPSDVRKQNGSFEDAFFDHEKLFKDMPEKVREWRTVLTKASNLSGWAWPSKETRSEAELVEFIASDILKKLKNVTPSTYVDGFVGLNSRVKEIESLLRFGSLDVQIIGIWGMGGIGKTTIADVIFKQYSREFEGSCFQEDVREKSENGVGLVSLRNRILSQILNEKIRIGAPGLPESVRRRLRQTKVLIVLDDVNKVGQLEYLAGGIDRFGLGSRVIITTRDREVLRNFGVCDTNIYEVRRLEYHDALELFSTCAFKEKQCPSDLLTLSESVVNYANGNPLALRVLGSFFQQKSKLEMEMSLEYLNKISDPDIYDVLKISYNDLQQDMKNIFLDIACFFVGEERDLVTRILDCGNFADYGLNILIEKSLVTISKWGGIQMHNLLQEMGRKIVYEECVEEPGKRSRLWYHEDISRVLKRNKGTDAIKGICLNLSKVRDLHLASRAFVNMPNLKILKFYVPEFCDVAIMSSKVHLKEGLEYLPDELRYLYWYGYPLKSLPSNFDPENLIALSLPYSEVEKIWEGEKEAPKLIFMDLPYSRHLTKIPNPLEFQSVTRLNLSKTAIEEVPSSIEYVTNLSKLNLSHCTRLKRLPTSISKLKSLGSLNLSGNRGLGSSLRLVTSLSNLRDLYLSDCALMEIPQDIGCLISLKTLDLNGNKLESLPESIGCLSSLLFLQLDDNNLVTLPKTFGCLSSLISLVMHGNNFESLPASMKQLSQLTGLNLANCNRLQSLPELPLSLTELSVINCKRLQSLPKVPSCTEGLDTSLLERLSCPFSTSHIGSYIDFELANRPKLNENEHNLLEDSQQMIQHMLIASLRTEREQQDTESSFVLSVPGSKIPGWITYQKLFDSINYQSSADQSITIHLPMHCGNRKLMGFVVCVVIGVPKDGCPYHFVKCDYGIHIGTPSETKAVWKKFGFIVDSINTALESDHISIGFSPCWDVDLPDGDHITICVSFHFSLKMIHKGKVVKLGNKLRSCGVCPVYLNADETKPNSLTLTFDAGSEGERGRIINSDDEEESDEEELDEEELEPSSKRICIEKPSTS